MSILDALPRLKNSAERAGAAQERAAIGRLIRERATGKSVEVRAFATLLTAEIALGQHVIAELGEEG